MGVDFDALKKIVGDYQKIAEITKCTTNNVSKWKLRARIPSEPLTEIFCYLQDKGIDFRDILKTTRRKRNLSIAGPQPQNPDNFSKNDTNDRAFDLCTSENNEAFGQSVNNRDNFSDREGEGR